MARSAVRVLCVCMGRVCGRRPVVVEGDEGALAEEVAAALQQLRVAGAHRVALGLVRLDPPRHVVPPLPPVCRPHAHTTAPCSVRVGGPAVGGAEARRCPHAASRRAPARGGSTGPCPARSRAHTTARNRCQARGRGPLRPCPRPTTLTQAAAAAMSTAHVSTTLTQAATAAMHEAAADKCLTFFAVR